MPTPAQANRLERDEEDLQRRRFQYAREDTERIENRATRRHVAGEIERTLRPETAMLPTVLALSNHERRSYSVMKAIHALATRTGGLTGPEPSLEREISGSITKDIGRPPDHGGIYVPLRLSASGLDSKTNASGGYLAQTKIGDIIDALRAHTRVLQLGAQFLSGLKYSVQFPVESNVLAASWVAQNPGSDVAASDPSFGAKSLTPHSLQATTSLSRGLFQQANQDLEAWIRARIGKAHAQALDAACINGPGTVNQPLGLLKTVGIGDVGIGATGGAPTSAMALGLEASIATANADNDSCAFLTTPAMRQKMRGIPEFTSGGESLWDSGEGQGQTVLGYKAAVSTGVPSTLVKSTSTDCHAVIFGDFSTLLVGEFLGAVEVVVDVFSLKKQNMIELSSYDAYDCMLSQPSAFACCQDARNV